MPDCGKVLVLNGASSSGKTTIAKALQAHLEEVYLLCGLDMFWNMTPPSVGASSVNFPHLKTAMARSIIALAETGHNVVVDIVLCGTEPDRAFMQTLKSINPVMIKVDCELHELERREQDRGNRKPGLARSQYETVHADKEYDLEIDTTTTSTDGCVQLIAEYLAGST